MEEVSEIIGVFGGTRPTVDAFGERAPIWPVWGTDAINDGGTKFLWGGGYPGDFSFFWTRINSVPTENLFLEVFLK